MYSAIRKNKINTILIMSIFFLIISGLGAVLGWLTESYTVTIGVCAFALVYAIFQYFFASSEAMAMAGGVQITEQDNPRLYRIVENLAISQGMPMPRVYVIEDPAPNAFATGTKPENAMVAATTGLLEIMDDQELEGVMAHELGHVKNYDIRVSMIVYGLIVVITLISDFVVRSMFRDRKDNSSQLPAIILGIVVAIIAPIIATLVQLAVSRQREYLADATGALMTRYPEGLASALQKLETHSRPMQKQRTSMSHMWISDPTGEKKESSFAKTTRRLFSTHPPIEDRVKRLLESGGKF